MIDAMTACQEFEPHVGTDFTIIGSDPAIVLTLIEAKQLKSTGVADGLRTPFSLLFQSTDERVLRQQIFGLEHPAMGANEIFLVPVAQNPTGIQYEATFN